MVDNSITLHFLRERNTLYLYFRISYSWSHGISLVICLNGITALACMMGDIPRQYIASRLESRVIIGSDDFSIYLRSVLCRGRTAELAVNQRHMRRKHHCTLSCYTMMMPI
jgi:hypothetical protein